MKKIILGSLLALCIAVPALAHPPITVYVDQQKVAFADQAPVIVDDRTLVPMRKIFEAMDADVTWDEPSQTITSTRGSDVVTMTIGQKQVYKNGKVVYTMDVPAQIMQDRTMVPIRAVALAFDANVAWDHRWFCRSQRQLLQADSCRRRHPAGNSEPDLFSPHLQQHRRQQNQQERL